MGVFYTASRTHSGSLYFRGTLHINDMHGNRLVSFLEEIPKNHIDDFFNTLCIYFKDFRDTDTKKEGPNHKYPSAHVDVYGRYTNRVSYVLFMIRSSG